MTLHELSKALDDKLPEFYECGNCIRVVAKEPKPVVVKVWDPAFEQHIAKVTSMCDFCLDRVQK